MRAQSIIFEAALFTMMFIVAITAFARYLSITMFTARSLSKELLAVNMPLKIVLEPLSSRCEDNMLRVSVKVYRLAAGQLPEQVVLYSAINGSTISVWTLNSSGSAVIEVPCNEPSVLVVRGNGVWVYSYDLDPTKPCIHGRIIKGRDLLRGMECLFSVYRANATVGSSFCPSWYLDPVLYNLTGDERLRGFIPSGTFKAVVPLLVETYFVDTPLEIFKSSNDFHAINLTLARIHIGDHIIEVILNPLIDRFDGKTFGRGEIYIIVDNNTLLTLSSYSPTYVRNLGYAYLTVKSLGEMVYSQDETGNLKGPEFILIIIARNYTITVGRVAYEYDYVLDWIANSILEITGLWWEHCKPPVGAFGMWSLGGSYDYGPCFGSIPCYYSTPGSCVFYDLASLIGVNRIVVANDHVYYAGYRGSEIHTLDKVSYTGKGIRYIEARAFGGYAKIPMINTIYILGGKEYRKCKG